MLNLKKLFKDYASSARSFSELVPWLMMIDDRTVLNKDGSLLSCYEIGGVDLEGVETIDSDGFSGLVEQALRNFDERTAIWSMVDRRQTSYYPEGTFEDRISTEVDAEWKKSFEQSRQYANFHYLCVMYVPPAGAESIFERISQLVRSGEKSMPAAVWESVIGALSRTSTYRYKRDELWSNFNEHRTRIAAFEETLASINLFQLSGDNLMQFLHDRCSPANAGVPVRVPKIPMYLDTRLADSTLTRGNDFLVFKGDKTVYSMAVSIKDWPDIVSPGLLDSLLAVPGEITLSQVFCFMDQDKARSEIQRMQKYHMNLSKSIVAYIKEGLTHQETDQIDPGRVALADDAAHALGELTESNRMMGYYNLTLTAYGASLAECNTTLTEAMKTLRAMGYLLVRESLHLLSAWSGTMPGQTKSLVRWFMANTGNLADLAPIRTIGVGDPYNRHLTAQAKRTMPSLTVLPTQYSTPFYFNFHRADLAHTMVIGPSRSGKSTFMNFLISQFLKYWPCNVVIFDKDYSCRIPTLMQGGSHIDMLEEGAKIKLNPLHLLGDESQWPFIVKWLEILITSRGFVMKAEHDEELWRAIRQIAGMPKEMWRLQTLTFQVGSNALREQLTSWIGEGQRARFFDNVEDDFQLSNFTCIEMGGLFADEPLARAFMDYAFHRISARLDGRPTLIYIEEAWFMLSDPHFESKINDWLRTLAKKNAFLVMATQSLDEIAKSGIFHTIVDNIPNRIFLPNPEAMNPARRVVYQSAFALNDVQIMRIRDAIPKREYYMVTPGMSRMVVCSLPQKIINVVRSDARAQRVFLEVYKNQDRWPGQDWKDVYLAEVAK